MSASRALKEFAEALVRCWAHNTDVNTPAVYLWITQGGNEIPLCEACCADWRARAVTEPDLAPARITMFTVPL